MTRSKAAPETAAGVSSTFKIKIALNKQQTIHGDYRNLNLVVTYKAELPTEHWVAAPRRGNET